MKIIANITPERTFLYYKWLRLKFIGSIGYYENIKVLDLILINFKVFNTFSIETERINIIHLSKINLIDLYFKLKDFENNIKHKE